MAAAARVLAGVVGGLVGVALSGWSGPVLATYGGLPPASASPPGSPRAVGAPPPHQRALSVAITKVGDGTIRPDHRLVIHGVVSNPGTTTWLDAQAYLQITTDPAATLADLQYFASVPDDPGLGNTLYSTGLFDDTIGNVGPGERKPFTLSIPFDRLGIAADAAGVYRVGVKVVAGTDAGRNPADAAHTSTLMPLLPTGSAADVTAQTVTLLPITAPVKRLDDGAFADDSLRGVLSAEGRLTNVLNWVALAPPHTVQLVVDPALVTAVTDMADGYQVQAADPSRPDTTGQGRSEAAAWLTLLHAAEAAQLVMYLPWGEPAVTSLLDHHAPGPVIASLAASGRYRDVHTPSGFVAGWLTDGSSGIRAVTVLHHLGADLQIVSQASLPGLAAYSRTGRYVPSQVTVTGRGRHIPLLVAATDLAGLPTTPATSALQFRQRLIADAAVRALDEHGDAITITALPFTWNPGVVRTYQGLGRAFSIPGIVAQSAIGALDRTATPYRGAVRSTLTAFNALGDQVVDQARALGASGGKLAAILGTDRATQDFQRRFAMSGSAQWRLFPGVGYRLIATEVADDQAALAKVTLTGPPFVAMSSNSGRFPLTVTNGLARPITVTVEVQPADPALSVQKIAPIQLDAGQQRDVQVVTTASGSGVTSVRARLATPEKEPTTFGRAWRFDVRSTQIGLVIWVVMAVGGAILLIAAGYRIVNRLRGNERPRRRAAT